MRGTEWCRYIYECAETGTYRERVERVVKRQEASAESL